MALRGAQLNTASVDADIQALINKGANVARVQIAAYRTQDYGNWMQQVRDHSDICAHWATVYGNFIQFIPCLMCWPDGATDAQLKMAWDIIIGKLNPLLGVRGFDLLNEPRGSNGAVNTRMQIMAEYVRKKTNKLLWLTVLNETPDNFAYAKNFNLTNVWWNVHMYVPMQLTHQGIPGSGSSGAGYPVGATYPTSTWNKDFLKKKLQPVRTFQQSTGRRIVVSEFSIDNLADVQSRVNYLTDLISIFELYNWSWLYHAWRESSYWDAEPYPQVLQVLANGWAKN